MGIADLRDPRAKLGRAEEHLRAFYEELRVFAEQYAKRITLTFGRAEPWHVLEVGPVPALPTHVALVMGDYLNNLRAALDHLVWQLVLREDKEPDEWHSFPFCQSRKDFLSKTKAPSKEGKHHGPLYGICVDGDAWTLIERAQPFSRPKHEKEALFSLAQLTNIDKHRMLLVQESYLSLEGFLQCLRWQDDLQPIWQNTNIVSLSAEHPTQIAHFLFPPGTDPRVKVQGNLPLEPSVGDGETQVGMSLMLLAGECVKRLLDQFATLPRVQS